MDILLINNNPVVERLFSICIENTPSRLDKKKFLTNKDLANYDIVFIDDTSYSNSIEEILKSTHIGTRILLASKKFQLDNPALFDEIIYKPFLPTKISEIIDTSTLHKKNNQIKKEKTPKQNLDTKILDPQELSEIKELLDNETTQTAQTKHKKHKKYKQALNELINSSIEEKIALIGKDKFKKALKKGLVSIEINIKKEK